jgi:hypothetical protein
MGVFKPWAWISLPSGLGLGPLIAQLNLRMRALAHALGVRKRERLTGVTGSTLTLVAPIALGSEMVVKNGTVLDPDTDYAIDGRNLTLTIPSVAGDVWIIWYDTANS